MILYIYRFNLLLLLTLSAHVTTSYTSNFITRLWRKTQETLTKEYSVNSSSFLDLQNFQGDIIIKAWPQSKISLEALKTGTPEEIKNTVIHVKNTTAKLTINTQAFHQEESIAQVTYTLLVPENISIKTRILTDGSITIDQVQGTIDAATENGSITINDSIKTVIAKATNGTIKVRQKKFDEPHTIFLETFKGSISLYVPKQTKASLHARTNQGTVTSQHPVTLYPQAVKLNKETWQRIKKEASGTLATGGAPITLETTKGNIILDEY